MNFRNILALLAASSCLSGPVLAQQSQITPVALQAQDVETDAEMRIRTSVKIKMRAQSISAAACHLQMGMDPVALTTPLEDQIVEFEKFVNALVVGDPSLNITQPEQRKKTHRAAQTVTDAWAPVKTAAASIAAGTGQVGDTDSILVHNLEILEHGHNFTAELVQQYANPAESTLADLFTIVLATRQGMLSQKISKESCMVTYSGASSEKLGETMSVFENTLYALRDGMPAAGLEAAPTQEISDGLSEALEQWYAVRPVLEDLQNGAEFTAEKHAAKMRQLDGIKRQMLDVSMLYVEFMKDKRSS